MKEIEKCEEFRAVLNIINLNNPGQKLQKIYYNIDDLGNPGLKKRPKILNFNDFKFQQNSDHFKRFFKKYIKKVNKLIKNFNRRPFITSINLSNIGTKNNLIEYDQKNPIRT